MKKKFIPFVVIAIISIAIVATFLSLASAKKFIVTQNGDLAQLPILMQAGIFQDSDCGMVINDMRDISQIITKSGKIWFFHDHGGMAKWLEDKEFKESAKIWVMSRDTKKWIDGRAAYYSLADETAMGRGFGAYENFREEYVDFDTMRLKMLRGETLRNPLIKKQLLGK